MGFLQRWRDASRWSKAGKDLADALGGLTGSSKERGVDRHVGELRAEAADALSRIQGSCDSDTREWIARNVYQLVLQAPRGEEGYRKLLALDQQMRVAGDVRHCAPWLARLLVLADHVCERAGGDGIAAGLLVAEMQGWIEHFMVENGVRGWGIPIMEESRFDTLRSSRPTAECVEFTPVASAGARGEALSIAAEALGLATDDWGSDSLMLAATNVTAAILTSALKAIGKDIEGLNPAERVAAAVGLWAVADATCQHARIATWELVAMVAHAQLFLNVAEARRDPEAAGAASGREGRMLRDVFCDVQASQTGVRAITPIGQAAKDFCRTGDERYLLVLGSAIMGLVPFVEFNRDVPLVRFR